MRLVCNFSSGVNDFYDMTIDLESNHKARFLDPETYSRTHSHDIDNDGYLDIIYVQADDGFNNTNGIDTLEILLDPFNLANNFNILKVPLGADCIMKEARGMVFADFNNDNLDDICFLGKDNKVRTILNSETQVGIENVQDKFEYDIYPNPAIDIINIDVPKNLNYEANLHDLNGRLISSMTNKSVIEIQNVPHGIYLIEITDLDTGQKIIDKIIKGN